METKNNYMDNVKRVLSSIPKGEVIYLTEDVKYKVTPTFYFLAGIVALIITSQEKGLTVVDNHRIFKHD